MLGIVVWVSSMWFLFGVATFHYGAPWSTHAIAMDFMIRDLFLGAFAPYSAYIEQEETNRVDRLFWLLAPISVIWMGSVVLLII